VHNIFLTFIFIACIIQSAIADLTNATVADSGSLIPYDQQQIIAILDSIQRLEKELPEVLIESGKRFLAVSDQMNFKKGTAVSYHVIGCGYAGIARFDLAMDHYLKALEIFEEIADTGRKASVYISLSQLFSGIGNQSKGVEYCSRALDLFESIGNKIGKALALNLMGTLNLKTDPSSSCEFFKKALTIREEIKDTLGIASCYNNLGICYQNDFDLNLSLNYYQRSLELYENLSEKLYMIVAMNNIGNVYGTIGDSQKRLEYLNKSLELTREISNSRAEVNVLNNLAHYYYSVGNYDDAIHFLNLSLAKAIEGRVTEFIPSIFEYLSEVSNAKGDYRKAFEYHRKFVSLKDSIYNESRNKIFDLQVAYITERENKENEMLRLQNSMKDMEVSRQIRYKLFFGLLLLLSAIVAVVVYRSYRIKKRTSDILSQQKKMLEEMNRDLAKSEYRLKELNMTKDKFFSIMAHDLKNPLGSMVSLADMVNHNFHKIPLGDLEAFVRNLHLSVKTVYNLLENLLIWSRSQTNRLDYSPEIFGLKQIAEECLQIFSFQAAETGIEIINEIKDNHHVLADKNMVFTVFRNVINNAIKFSYPGGKIKISSKDNGDYISTIITDEGIGMTDEDMNKLFRIDVPNTTIGNFVNGSKDYYKKKGTGLGLILCKEFVEKCGGKIRVESEQGKGSSFIFTLPSENNKSDGGAQINLTSELEIKQ